jgi:tetratricopeptide (TPR) repeat protein
MGQRLLIACTVLWLSRPAAGGETTRILLLGDSTTAGGNAPAGLNYADWVQTLLEPPLAGKLEVVSAGLKDGTVKEGREAAGKRLAPAPEVIVLGFGLDDALRSTPEDFRREYEGLLADLERGNPTSRLLLTTGVPLDDRHRLAREERFRQAGGIGQYLKKGFVEPVRELAERRKLALADHHRLIEEALAAGEKLEDLLQPESSQPTARGNLLLARSTALSILYLVGRRAGPPSSQDVLRGEGTLPSPSPADLASVLAVWSKDLEPLWLLRLRDEDPDVRLGALRQLQQAGTLPANFFDALLGFLEPAAGERSRPNEVEQILAAAVGSGQVGRENAAAALVSLIRKAGLNSFAAASAFPFLEKISSGQWGTSRPQARRLPPGPPLPAGGAPQVRETAPLKWGEDDLSLFGSALAAREQAIRLTAATLLVSAGEAARVFAEVKRAPEKPAVEILRHLWQLQRGGAASLREAYFEMARGEAREGLRLVCLELVFSLPAQEIPLDLLRGLFARESGSLLIRSAQALAARGGEGLEVLVPALRSEEEDRVRLSRTGLFYMGLYSSSDEVGRRALAALLEHFTPERRKEILEFLEATLQKSSPPLVCAPVPAGLPLAKPGIPSRAIRMIPAPGPIQPGNWPAESGDPRVERLQDFLPRLEASLLQGADDEKEAAERILQLLWQTARNIESRRPTEEAAPLAARLQKEAQESMKKGDATSFLRKARQAIAAGASAATINSFAWTRATSPREDLRDPREAEAWAREAIARGGRAPVYLDTLAAALAGQGKFKEALEAELEAIENLGEENPAPFAARALLYLSGKPYRKN